MVMSPIPKTAPFAEEEIDLLNRVVGPASANQRAWLAGFLAGLDAAAGGAVALQPAASSRPAEPLTIVYASESGNSEKLAGDFAKSARKNGLKPTIIDMADLDLWPRSRQPNGWWSSRQRGARASRPRVSYVPITN